MDENVDGQPAERLHVVSTPIRISRNEAMKQILAEREKSHRIRTWLRLWYPLHRGAKQHDAK